MSKKQEYARYLQSNHWRGLKAKKARRITKRCGLCGSKDQIDLHHLVYRNWHDVKTEDLRWLCRECHGLVHRLMDAGKIRPRKKNKNNPLALWVLLQHAVMRAAKKAKMEVQP